MVFQDSIMDMLTLDYLTQQLGDGVLQKSLAHSGLVQVTKIVQKPKQPPFEQKFWVRPDQVKSGGNKHEPVVEKEFHSASELDGLYEKQWNNPITTAEKQACMLYINANDYVASNNEFWRRVEKSGDTNSYLPEELNAIKQVSGLLDSAISKSHNDAIVVYRIMNRYNGGKDFVNLLKNLQKSNGVFQDDGYMSTTLIDHDNADDDDDEYSWDDFYLSEEDTEIISLKIHLPEGSGIGAYVEPLAPPEFKYQHEFLLGRGSQFEIMTDMSNYDGSESIELRWKQAVKVPFENTVQYHKDQQHVWTAEELEKYNEPDLAPFDLNRAAKYYET